MILDETIRCVSHWDKKSEELPESFLVAAGSVPPPAQLLAHSYNSGSWEPID